MNSCNELSKLQSFPVSLKFSENIYALFWIYIFPVKLKALFQPVTNNFLKVFGKIFNVCVKKTSSDSFL